jgi:hypothetical protein
MEDFGFGMTGIARARKAVSGIVKVANAGGAHMILVVLTARFVLLCTKTSSIYVNTAVSPLITKSINLAKLAGLP